MMGICPICGNEFQVTNKWGCRRKTCLECTNKQVSLTLKSKGIKPPSQKGKKWGVDYPIKNHNWWKGGVTPMRSQIWGSKMTQEWRAFIFKRDDYTCKFCGSRGGRLCVDHYPKTFSSILQEYNVKSLEDAMNCEALWDTNNGRTLCESCHRLTPTYGTNTKYLKEGKLCLT